MFWNNPKDQTTDLSTTDFYSRFENMKSTNDHQYRCDPLTYSPMIFAGSCDMSGPIDDPTQVWSLKVHQELMKIHGSFPYIALSRLHTGFTAMLRRLIAYCKTYGAPKRLYIVLPRPVCVEIPLHSQLVNVTERERYINFIHRSGLLTDDEHAICIQAMSLARAQQDNAEYQLYQFEQNATMLQLICERYNIELRWTPNLSATAIDYYARWITTFLEDNQYMLQTCVGVAPVIDFAIDGSTGQKTQASIANTMLGARRPNLDKLKLQADENLRILKTFPELYKKITTDAARVL